MNNSKQAEYNQQKPHYKFIEMNKYNKYPLGKDIEYKKYSLEEVKQHSDEGWVVYDGVIYDIRQYLSYHPGGKSIIKQELGKDITQVFSKYEGYINRQMRITTGLT